MSFRLGVMLLLGSLTGCWQRTDSPPLNDDPEKCMREARGYMDTNRPGEAIKCLEGFIQRTGNKNGEISELLASACLLDQDMELAALYFEQAASLSELKYYCYLKAAEIYEKLGDYSQAIPCYKWYLQILPEDSEIQVKYAQALLLDGEKKKALAILVAHCIDDAKVHNQIAELFFEMENYIQGRNWYFSAFGCEKNNLEALRGLWKVNLYLRDWEALQETGNILLDLGERFIDDRSVEEVVESLRARKRAWTLLNDLDVHFPKVTLPMFVTEAEYFDTPSIGNGKSSPVVSDVVDGKNKKVEELQAEVQKAKAKGNFDDAIDILWKILGLDARNVMAWEDLTDCLLKGNKYDIAEMAIQEVIKFEPERIDFYLTYLDIVLRTHNSMDYVRILRETKQKFPRDADLCLLWARAQEMYIGDGKKAKHFYEKFLQLAPERHPEISKVQRLLERYPEG